MIRQAATILLSLCAFNVLATTSSPNVIYGEDNRVDTFESKSSFHKHLAKSTAAMIPTKSIVVRGNTAELNGRPLTEFRPNMFLPPVCSKERFSHQPTAANCSGFLVAKNIIATAGHCMTS